MAIISRITTSDAIGTTSASYGGAPKINHLLLCACLTSSASSTLTGWTQITSQEVGSVADYLYLFAKSSAGTEGTVAPSGGTVYFTTLCEYAGAAIPYALDGTPVTTGTATSSTSFSTGNISTTNRLDLIFSCCGLVSIATPSSLSWTSATAILANSGTDRLITSGQYLTTNTATSFFETASWTTGAQVATIIAGFKPALIGNLASMGVGS